MTEITSTWQEFLKQQAANFSAELSDNFVTPLNDLGIIAVCGDDAASFLHNQLTNDVEHLTSNQVRRAGYCTPKGRLLASFLMWKNQQGFFLQLPKEIQAAVQKRMQMFIMRSKVKMADVSDSQIVLALGGNAVGAALAKWFPNLPDAPYANIENEHGCLMRLDDAQGIARYQWHTTTEMAITAWPGLVEKLTPVDSRVWRLGEIEAGIPQITLATQEQFVPQMINFEVIGGVNFKKGCYPGQEIVARSQYLGKLKRRAVIAKIVSAEVAAGMAVFSSADPAQPCGMIINAESSTSDTFICILEIKLAALENGSVHLGSADGAPLTVLPLPYAMPDAN
ncbi:CAF17-like 4Fe-4S cluster assembly/insertion protein YgfZ [Glaciimonas soli]|uniref:Folate-binding protein n=1 Tax=Glaciimonas soli TaxID=2590999 RepID=A0A843YR02_9BURK|nr:folate-binding protein YgfZ [Glaciimonas soli]MQQ99155.1 folate-binding protein [Glaciimonas soli]